ncbi:DENN domain protein, partial [Dictyocaulus viviparus]
FDTSSESCVWESDGLTLDSIERRPPLQRSFVAKILHHFPQKRAGAPFSDEVLSEVRDSRICEAMSLLHTEHVRKLTAEEPSFDRERMHVPPGTVSGGTHTLPRGRKNKTKRISYYDGGTHNTLFMSKTLCLITRLPLVYSTTTILKTLHEVLISDTKPILPVESYIYWILNEIPLPLPGTTLKVSMLNSTILVQRPGLRELPIFDDSLGAMFQVSCLVNLCILLSGYLHTLFLYSIFLVNACYYLIEYSRLMCVSEALCALAFPFRWQMVYVPILPYSQLKFVEAPVGLFFVGAQKQ